jgi:hypothetical protein
MKQLTTLRSGAFKPAWSSDGDRLVLVTQLGPLRTSIATVGADGSGARTILARPALSFSNPDW